MAEEPEPQPEPSIKTKHTHTKKWTNEYFKKNLWMTL